MASTSSKENTFIQPMLELLKILDVREVPDALIKQIAFRMGSKPNPSAERKLEASLKDLKVKASKNFTYPDVIAFDVQEAGGDIPLKDDFFFNGNAFQRTVVLQDLFTVVDECLLAVLGKPSKNLRESKGFQFLHETVEQFLDGCDNGKFDVNDSVTKYFQNICQIAKREILGTEKTVNSAGLLKYQKYLEIQEALIPFQSLGKPKDLIEAKVLLEIPLVAERAIEIIMRSKFKYSEAVAIYNRRFGCAYEPLTGVAIICAVCHKVNRFDNIKLNEKCACGESLFRKCGKADCGVTVLRVIDTCPHCGSRESDFEQFTNNIDTSKILLSKGCIEQAEMCFASARAIAPYRESELKSLQKAIDGAKSSRTSILAEIDDLVNQRAFFSAAKKLADAKRKVPPTLLSNVEQRIINAQSNADKKFTEAHRTTEELQTVLAICADHPGALERIAKIPPKPPARLVISEHDSHIQLSWDALSEFGVNYRLMRKKNTPPETAFDGDVIETTDKPFARDTSPIPGKIYYAVFAERGSNFSIESANKSLVFLPEVLGLSLRQLSDRVEISYQIPKGASGVRVMRKSNGKALNIYEGTKTIAVDRTVPEQCSYVVTTLYENRESKEKLIPFTASVLPKAIEPQIHLEQNKVFVSWNTKQKGFDVKVLELTQNSFIPENGNIYTDNELSGKSREISVSSCEESGTDFNVKPNHEHKLVVMIGNSNGWLCCGMFPIYAGVYPKIKRMPQRVDLRGEHYFVFDESLPANVSEVLYAVSKENKTPSSHEFKRSEMNGHVGIEVPAIKVQNLGHTFVGRCYIFCRFKLNDGKETAPVSSEVHFRQNIQVQVNLKKKGINLKGDIRIKLCRYDFEGYSELPELRLMVGSATFEIDKCVVTPLKSDYICQFDLQLPAPINNRTEIKLYPVDSTFANDFTINYKY